mmetsp:Transcript_14186/g.38439  ORF Transcript_14186/g.38439 Transcript_14186/m.38439 type:complete len:229 (-) Transcript_14186:469-1155(-)
MSTAAPKSMILTSPSVVISRLSGLTSLCTMPRSCSFFRPIRTWRRMDLMISVSRFSVCIVELVRPSTYSSRHAGKLPSCPSSALPNVASLSNFHTSHCEPLLNAPSVSSATKYPRYCAHGLLAHGFRLILEQMYDSTCPLSDAPLAMVPACKKFFLRVVPSRATLFSTTRRFFCSGVSFVLEETVLSPLSTFTPSNAAPKLPPPSFSRSAKSADRHLLAVLSARGLRK